MGGVIAIVFGVESPTEGAGAGTDDSERSDIAGDDGIVGNMLLGDSDLCDSECYQKLASDLVDDSIVLSLG